MSDSVRPHRRQPTRLPHPWDSPGKNTGVGCHFLLQCMKGKRESEVGQSCPTPSDPMDCGPPGFCVHGIFQARVLERGAIALSGNNPGWGTVRSRNHSSPCFVPSERSMWHLIVPPLLPQDLACFLSTCLKHKFKWERGGSLLGCKS